MSFTSLDFALLLAATLAVYYFLSARARLWLLLAASYVFYCSWNPVYGLLILASTLIDYLAALAIERSADPGRRRLALAASVLTNLGILGYFKYTDFALENLRALLGPLGENLPGPVELVLPVGISFYTFQTMSYTIDVYRREKKAEKDFALVALYVSFFPQLVAGPIERATKLMPQLAARQPFRWHNLETGLGLVLWGLAKKLLIADRLILAAYPVFLEPQGRTTGELVFAALGMQTALYLDFSAYSEIARGAARLFGVRLSRNFDFPQTARNVAEWWRRWHLTMGAWLRDYLYYPLLGGFRPRNLVHHARTTLVTMALVGLWHGADWTFVLWGLASGLSIIVYRMLRLGPLQDLRGSRLGLSIPGRFGSWMLARSVSVVIGILFYAPDLSRANLFYAGLAAGSPTAGFGEPAVRLGLIVVASFHLVHYLLYRSETEKSWSRLPAPLRALGYATIVVLIVIGGVRSAEPFYYYQF